MGPTTFQEFQVKLPRFGDFYFFALKKRLFLKLNFFLAISLNLSFDAYLLVYN